MAKVSADLRVVGGGGKILAEETLKTGTTSVPTSSRAICFGKGTGGSGKVASVKGATAFGLLAQAAKSTKALQPLLVTDTFDFGLGLCGVGGYKTTSKVSWYLKVNHKNPEIGGDTVKLKAGDEVLWAYTSFPYPNELDLEAPEQVTAGVPFTVRVFSYSDTGKRKPVSGARITGVEGVVTGADGRASVTLSSPSTALGATRGKDIPAPTVVVLTCPEGRCPTAGP